MDYPSLPKLEQTEPITTRDMTKFVVDYIRSDQLGVIDNAHKALADIEKDGVQSRKCLCLAELHSLAVDAPKTGKWPSTQGIKIEMFPDFMMKSDKPSYPSEKVIGKLFRRCRKFKMLRLKNTIKNFVWTSPSCCQVTTVSLKTPKKTIIGIATRWKA